MSLFFPILYSTSLFGILSLVCYSTFSRVKSNYNLDREIKLTIAKLKEKPLPFTSIYAKLAILYSRKKFFHKSLFLFKSEIKSYEFDDQIGIGYNYYILAMAYSNIKKQNLAQYYFNVSKKLLSQYPFLDLIPD